MSILDKIVQATRVRVEADKRANPHPAPAPRLTTAKSKRSSGEGDSFAFTNALRAPGISFICEVKQASPSKGRIVEDFDHLKVAHAYAKGGAAAISVLTEPDFFAGSDRYLVEISDALELPLLRKDFVIDSYQICQAAALGADAVLLICAILAPSQLSEYQAQAHELGMAALVECHDEAEVARALEADAQIVGVNNRDLRTFKVDISTSVRLRDSVPPEVLFVSESGIRTVSDVELLRAAGVDAVLVGESLMRASDPTAALRKLRGEDV